VRYRSPDFVFGSSYTSRTRTRLEGDLSDVNPMTGLLADDGRVDIYLPDRWQTGFAFRVGPELWWETDFDWVGWSYVDRLEIVQADGTLANPGRSARNAHDTVSLYTAMKWRYASDLTLYAGLGYDPTPIDERDVMPTVSMVRKTRLGLGFTRDLGEGWSLGLAYQFIYGHDRQVSDTVQDGAGASDTRLYEGNYSSRTHVLGVSVGGRF
jgi:long-subunit fatty acid transport protein